MHFDDLPRNLFSLSRLHRQDLQRDPIAQLLDWLNDARKANIQELNAMTLTTTSNEGKPSCRTVLLKEVDDKGLLFFTNYGSRKAKEISENGHVVAMFFWAQLMRQLTIEGFAERTSPEKSAEYFSKRPRESRIGAWASPQDQPMSSFEMLERNYNSFKEKFEGKDVPLPPFWGGFRIIPHRLEFWQGGNNRLHDRFQYTLEQNQWKIERLAP